MAVVAVIGPSLMNVVGAIAITLIPSAVRVIRSQALTVLRNQYVDGARAIGATDRRVMFFHVLPNCMAPLIVQLSFIFAYAVLTEAVLSFLGLGQQLPRHRCLFIPGQRIVNVAGGQHLSTFADVARFYKRPRQRLAVHRARGAPREGLDAIAGQVACGLLRVGLGVARGVPDAQGAGEDAMGVADSDPDPLASVVHPRHPPRGDRGDRCGARRLWIGHGGRCVSGRRETGRS